jgi:hypothetical protein
MDVAFYLVHPEASAERPKLARFREWLLGQTVASLTVRDTHPTSPLARHQHGGNRRSARRQVGNDRDRQD